MYAHIVTEYQAQYALWRRHSPRRASNEYIHSLRDAIGFVTFERGSGTYKVLNIPGRVLDITDKMKRAENAKSERAYFADLYKQQTRTQATPAESRRVMAELIASGDYQEYATEQTEPKPSYDWHNLIPSFTERMAA